MKPSAHAGRNRPLAAMITRAMIARQRESALRMAALPEAVDDESSKWMSVAIGDDIAAARQAVRAILAWAPGTTDLDAIDPEKHRWSARGVRVGGRLYLALPHPDRDGIPVGSRDPGGCDVMFLAVVDSADIVTLEDLP